MLIRDTCISAVRDAQYLGVGTQAIGIGYSIKHVEVWVGILRPQITSMFVMLGVSQLMIIPAIVLRRIQGRVVRCNRAKNCIFQLFDLWRWHVIFVFI